MAHTVPVLSEVNNKFSAKTENTRTCTSTPYKLIDFLIDCEQPNTVENTTKSHFGIYVSNLLSLSLDIYLVAQCAYGI